IYISHRLDEIPRIGDRVTVLSDGRTVATGLPADTPRGELVEKMVGRKVDLDGRKVPAGRPDVAIARGMGLAPEDRKSQGLLLGWSLSKNVSVSDLGQFTTLGWINQRA